MTHRMSKKDLIIPLVITKQRFQLWLVFALKYEFFHCSSCLFKCHAVQKCTTIWSEKWLCRIFSRVKVLQQGINAFFHRHTTARVPSVPDVRVVWSCFFHTSWNFNVFFLNIKHHLPIVLHKIYLWCPNL